MRVEAGGYISRKLGRVLAPYILPLALIGGCTRADIYYGKFEGMNVEVEVGKDYTHVRIHGNKNGESMELVGFDEGSDGRYEKITLCMNNGEKNVLTANHRDNKLLGFTINAAKAEVMKGR